MRSYLFKFLRSFLNSESVEELQDNLAKNLAKFLGELSALFDIDSADFELVIAENDSSIPLGYLVSLDSDGSRIYLEYDDEGLADLMENPYTGKLSYLCWELLVAASAVQIFRHYEDNVTGLRFASSLMSALLLREIGDRHFLNEVLEAKLESCQYLLDDLESDHENYTIAMVLDFMDSMVVLMVSMMPKSIAVDYGSVFQDLVTGDVEKYYEDLFDMMSKLTEIEIEKISGLYDAVSEVVSIQSLFPFDDETNSRVYG